MADTEEYKKLMLKWEPLGQNYKQRHVSVVKNLCKKYGFVQVQMKMIDLPGVTEDVRISGCEGPEELVHLLYENYSQQRVDDLLRLLQEKSSAWRSSHDPNLPPRKKQCEVECIQCGQFVESQALEIHQHYECSKRRKSLLGLPSDNNLKGECVSEGGVLHLGDLKSKHTELSLSSDDEFSFVVESMDTREEEESCKVLRDDEREESYHSHFAVQFVIDVIDALTRVLKSPNMVLDDILLAFANTGFPESDSIQSVDGILDYFRQKVDWESVGDVHRIESFVRQLALIAHSDLSKEIRVIEKLVTVLLQSERGHMFDEQSAFTLDLLSDNDLEGECMSQGGFLHPADGGSNTKPQFLCSYDKEYTTKPTCDYLPSGREIQNKLFTHKSSQQVVSEYFKCAERITHVPFLGEVTVFSCDSDGLEYVDIENDVTLNVPEGAVPEGMTIHFEYAVALYGPFKFAPDRRPISPIVWLCSQEDVELLKPFELSIPHFLTDLTDEERHCYDLSFAKADHNDYDIHEENKVYKFRPIKDRETQFMSDGKVSYGTVLGKRCFLCIVAGQSKEVALRAGYCLTRVECSPLRTRHVCYFIATFFLSACLEQLRKYYPREEGFVVCPDPNHFRFKSDHEHLQIEIPSDDERRLLGLRPLNGQIIASEIDFWRIDQTLLEHMQEERIYPPKIMLTIERVQESDAKPLALTIRFHGHAEGNLDERIILSLENRQVSPTIQQTQQQQNSPMFATHGNGTPLNPHSPPQMRELMKLVPMIPTKWFDIGIMLNLTVETLHRIESQYQGNHNRCYCELFNDWKKRRSPDSLPYSWHAIVDVLKDPTIGEPLLAEKLEKRFQSEC